MNYNKQKESISIVIVGKFNPIYIHAKWMCDFGIITESEMSEIVENSITIQNDISKFYVNKLFEFSCFPNRIQVITHDIALSFRIVKLIKDILIVSKTDEFTAVGINADMDFTFYNVEDSYNFGKYFTKLDIWDDYLNEPRVLSMSFTDHTPTIEKSCCGNPKRTIVIKSIGENKGIPIVQIVCNNHFNSNKSEDINKILDEAEGYYANFRVTYDRLINNIDEKEI